MICLSFADFSNKQMCSDMGALQIWMLWLYDILIHLLKPLFLGMRLMLHKLLFNVFGTAPSMLYLIEREACSYFYWKKVRLPFITTTLNLKGGIDSDVSEWHEMMIFFLFFIDLDLFDYNWIDNLMAP